MRYSTHLPVLIEALNRTTGDVLELGPGVFSTPVLHWLCEAKKRYLLSVETDDKWYKFCSQYLQSDLHHFLHVANWDDANDAITKTWDVVLVDHSPSERRVEEIKKLANLAQYLVVHDSDPWKDKHYHYSTIYPRFKYKYFFDKADHHSVVLSNFVDLTNFIV